MVIWLFTTSNIYWKEWTTQAKRSKLFLTTLYTNYIITNLQEASLLLSAQDHPYSEDLYRLIIKVCIAAYLICVSVYLIRSFIFLQVHAVTLYIAIE